MNSKSFVLLEHLYDLCGERPFLILDAEEACPVGMKVEDLADTVKTLEGEGFVAVKYADKGEYCLGVTKEGRSLVLEVRDERERRKQAAEEAAKAEAERKERERREREAKEAAERERKMREEEENARKQVADKVEAVEAATVEDEELPCVAADKTEGQALPQKAGDVSQEIAPKAPIGETRTVLYVWLAAFMGALLGGGIVGLVMYVLHVVLK